MTDQTIGMKSLLLRPMTAQDADIRLFLECFTANGSPRTEDLLRWQYIEPPPGQLFADIAVTATADSLAAVYAVFPSRMKVGDGRILGVQSLDTLTDVNYRGQGLFVRLATSLYARLESEGVAFVYGFPNASSAHGFFSKLDWVSSGRVPFLIRPLRSGYALNRLGFPELLSRLFDFRMAPARAPHLASGQVLKIVERPDSDFTRVWRSFSGAIPVAVERDADYLCWRLGRPGEAYRTVALYEKERLLGYVVFGTNAYGGGSVGKLMDLIYDPARPDAGRLLVSAAIWHLAESGAGAVWAWNLEHSPNRQVLQKAGFISLPKRFHPIELHFGARGFNAAAQALVSDRRNWYISLLDSDTD